MSMMQAPLEHNRFDQNSVSRKFRPTEDYTIGTSNVVQNSVIKNLLITALDATSAEVIEQNLVIRDFLTTEEREHHNEF
jgi:hypothetical protein